MLVALLVAWALAAPAMAPAVPVLGVDAPLVNRRYGWQLEALGAGWRAVEIPATLAAFVHDDGTVAVVVRVPGPSQHATETPSARAVDKALRPRVRGYRREAFRARKFERPGRPPLFGLDVGYRAAGPAVGGLRMLLHPASSVAFQVERPVKPSRAARTAVDALLARFGPVTLP